MPIQLSRPSSLRSASNRMLSSNSLNRPIHLPKPYILINRRWHLQASSMAAAVAIKAVKEWTSKTIS